MLAQTTRSFHRMAMSVAAACTICAFAMQAPRQLADLPPALAAVMRDARADAERLAAELPDASARGDAWGNLGMLYHAHRLRYLAQDAYQRAVAEADGPRWRYLHGIALSELGEIERAAADFQHVTRVTPDSMPAWYRLGVALLLTGDLAGAQSALEKALELNEKSALVLAALADVATARADHRAALALLTQAWGLEPEAGQLAYKLAMAHRAVGDSAAASAWLARQPDNSFAPKIDDPLLLEVAQMSRSARFYEIAADWALGRGDLDAAINALRAASGLGPADVGVALRLAAALSDAGRRDEAVVEVRRALAVDPDSARAWHRLAWLLRRPETDADQRVSEEAIARSLALEPDPGARALAAAFAMRNQRFAAALEHYRQLVLTRPDDAYGHYWLGMAQLGGGDCAASEAFAEALRLRPNWGEAHVSMARADALCGRGEEAHRRAVTLHEIKADTDTRITLALAEIAIGRPEHGHRLAAPELPEPDAVLVVEAIASGRPPSSAFAPESDWWLPPEVR